MSEENQEIELSIHEQNWAMHQFCRIPYHEAKKIEDPEERRFLINMAVIMKQQQDKRAEQERLRKEQLTKQFEGQLGSVLAPPNDDDSKS
jgi:UDP-N-acetylglucosamine:LPS N-acetylglucosamine transferase